MMLTDLVWMPQDDWERADVGRLTLWRRVKNIHQGPTQPGRYYVGLYKQPRYDGDCKVLDTNMEPFLAQCLVCHYSQSNEEPR